MLLIHDPARWLRPPEGWLEVDENHPLADDLKLGIPLTEQYGMGTLNVPFVAYPHMMADFGASGWPHFGPTSPFLYNDTPYGFKAYTGQGSSTDSHAMRRLTIASDERTRHLQFDDARGFLCCSWMPGVGQGQNGGYGVKIINHNNQTIDSGVNLQYFNGGTLANPDHGVAVGFGDNGTSTTEVFQHDAVNTGNWTKLEKDGDLTPHHWILSWKTSEYSIWRNGVRVVSAASRTQTIGYSNAYMMLGLGSITTGLNYLGTFWNFYGGDAIIDDALAMFLYEHQWGIYKPRAERLYNFPLGVAAGGTEIEVPTSNIVWTGYAPSLTLSITPAESALSWTGYAPLIDFSITPGESAITWTGFAPTVDIDASRTVYPGVGTLSWTGYAPSLTFSITPAESGISWTGYAPTVSQNRDIEPGVGTLSWTGYAPSLSQDRSITPGVADIDWTGYAPSLTLSITPGIASISWTGYAPVVTAGAIPDAADQRTISIDAQSRDIERSRDTDGIIVPDRGITTNVEA